MKKIYLILLSGTYRLGEYKSYEPYNLIEFHDHIKDDYFETNDFSGGNLTVTHLDTVKKSNFWNLRIYCL